MSVGAFFKKTLPNMALTVASGVPGPVGMVAGLIGQVLGKDLKPDSTALDTAIQGATPDQILQLKLKDLEVKEAMTKMGYDDLEEMAKLSQADTADARARQVALKDKMPAVLAVTITLGFFGTLALLTFHGIPANGHDLVVALEGSLGTAWITVVGYYFGSSAGSAAKNSTIQNMLTNGNGH